MTDSPGVIAPPPLLLLGAIAVGLALEALWPIAGIAHRSIGMAIFLAGLLLAVWAIISFRRAGTNVETRKPSTSMVAAGPYRFTRNPIYVGMAGIIVGLGLAIGSAWTILMVVPFLIVIDRGVIAREERYLSIKFAADYGAYRARVRRWI